MKHIKKHFLLEHIRGEQDYEKDSIVIDLATDSSPKLPKRHKDYKAYIETETGFTYGCFIHNINGKKLLFPVPDPTLTYFNNASLMRDLHRIRPNKKNQPQFLLI
jgi:hypothetical protein|tara:strand:- start:842 stop:1156 length:315 start_codon:yes stop_codon:yes gene_type:complete